MSDVELCKDARFRGHATVYMHTLDDVAHNLHNLNGPIFSRLMLLGARHASMPGFKHEHIKVSQWFV